MSGVASNADSVLVGVSARMLSVANRIPAIARVQRTTLICGPTGSGKDVVARLLHEASLRRERAFIVVHCAALPDSLVEAELFGHSRGAFTGAVQNRGGLIRGASQGTLFLDEIDSLTLGAQAKLLRFLESGEYRAIGTDRVERSDAWVVAATNQDLRARVRVGAFREDLLYRLEVVKIDLPPLSDRRGDVMVLARHFLARLGLETKRFSPAASAALEEHDWPGNVRELKHRVESAALLTDGDTVEPDALGLSMAATPDVAADRDDARQVTELPPLEEELWKLIRDRGLTLLQATAQCERLLVHAALRAEGNNRTRAASRLGINVRTIYKKIGR